MRHYYQKTNQERKEDIKETLKLMVRLIFLPVAVLYFIIDGLTHKG